MIVCGSTMDVFHKGLVTTLAIHALFIAISLPLFFRKVPRNVVYGFRTRKTLSDDEIWYEANAYFASRFIVATLASTAAFLWFFYSVQVEPQSFVVVPVIAIGLPVVIAGVLSTHFVRSL